jgi:putative spermidine/putrescine transport system permease protein
LSKPVRSRRLQLSAALHRRPKLKLAVLLAPPLLWIGVIYLGSLGLLFASSLWRFDDLTGKVVRDWGFTNFRTIWDFDVYHTVAFRTVEFAAAVTLIDIVLAFPLAYYAARIAGPRSRTVVLLLIVMPLWSSYLVRAFAWRTILANNGVLDWATSKLGLGTAGIGYSNTAVLIVFCYLWLPFVILPIYTALERIPSSYLEASQDLGARSFMTFRRIVLPLAKPGIIAGSIFSFSLTLGDYIAPALVGKTQFIGTIVKDNVGVAGNVPLAAAYAIVPVVIMAVYLTFARRMGAFEAL